MHSTADLGFGLIQRLHHRRLRLLLVVLNEVSHIFVTPNTLTEASNLLHQHGEPKRSLLMDGLALLIEERDEILVASAQAAVNPYFGRLGLTDPALL